jgi:maltooligosyltrehalose trehalohydrolase
MARRVGALLSDSQCVFTVWAPLKETMTLHIVAPVEQRINMQKDEQGYFTAVIEDVDAATRYFYMPDGQRNIPDPASAWQPEGVHGPSAVVDHNAYNWHDRDWRGVLQDRLVFYEVHVGTFTPEGTFDAIIPRLNELAVIGITAIELMPVGQFPGNRNWGYDGAYPYAVQASYGGPEGLKKLADACHERGIALYLDVVYNHLGPEGNYLGEFAPYFTDKYKTPWGEAVNFDGEWSDGVRSYFCNNAVYWLKQYHIDGLRVDAIHQMYDQGAIHFWELMGKTVRKAEQKAGRHFRLIAESDLNNPKVVKNPEAGGYGFDAQWLDDFHHALYVSLYKKGLEQYEDFGKIEQLAKAYTDGFVHSGEYVQFRKKRFGASSIGLPGDRFVVFNQNHDQVGNAVGGARLSTLIGTELCKVAAAAMLLAPYLPMLFMGEEYGEDAPFTYFVSHSDEALIAAVREGRKKEFAYNQAPPDPQSEDTFNSCVLQWEKRHNGKHKELLEWHKTLLALRRKSPALKNYNKNDVRVYVINPESYGLHRRSEDEQSHVLSLFNMGEENASFILPTFTDVWHVLLTSKNMLSDDNTLSKGVKANTTLEIPAHSVLILSNKELEYITE